MLLRAFVELKRNSDLKPRSFLTQSRKMTSYSLSPRWLYANAMQLATSVCYVFAQNTTHCLLIVNVSNCLARHVQNHISTPALPHPSKASFSGSKANGCVDTSHITCLSATLFPFLVSRLGRFAVESETYCGPSFQRRIQCCFPVPALEIL